MSSRISLIRTEKTRPSVLFVMAFEDGVLKDETASVCGIGPLIEEFEVGSIFTWL